MPPKKKTDPKTTDQKPESPKDIHAEMQAKATEEVLKKTAGYLRDTGQRTFSTVTSEAKKLEAKVKELPVDRRVIFFLGIAVLIAAFLGDIGTLILSLIGIGMVYVSYSGDNFASKYLDNQPTENKK